MYGLFFYVVPVVLFCYLYSFTDTDDQHDLHITWRLYQIMFVSFNRNTSGAETAMAYERGVQSMHRSQRAKKAHLYLRRTNLKSTTLLH
jgi:hypothetical protein